MRNVFLQISITTNQSTFQTFQENHPELQSTISDATIPNVFEGRRLMYTC